MAATRRTGHNAGAGNSGNDAGAEPPDYSRLTEAGREALAAAAELFREFNPQPGLLGDLPQVTVAPTSIARVCQLAKDSPRLALKMLLCLSCVDYAEYFQLVYFLHSLDREQTLVVKTNVPYANPRLPSVAGVWPAAEWYEREARDLFGVDFDGNPDGAPLLLYEGFEGFPGRKEFPFYEYREF